MFAFDRSKLNYSYNKMKSCTTALGGSMHIVDPDAPAGSEELIKVDVPFAVMRKFVSETKLTKYLKPVEIAVLRYGDQVISIERDLATGILHQEEGQRWVSKIEKFIDECLDDALGGRAWYFDGRYIFNIEDETIKDMQSDDWPHKISADGTFRTADVRCIDLYEANKPVWELTGILTEERGIIIYKNGDAFSLTPPIWKNVDAIGSSATIQANPVTEHEDYLDETRAITITEDRLRILIDSLDRNFNVNINFTLNSAKVLSNIFGFDAVEPLQLPEIMLKLSTVNIPSLPKSVKSTFCIGLRPSHALAWLMGMLPRCTKIEDYIQVRATIKYLTTKGIFHQVSTQKSSLFVTNEPVIPPMLDVSTVPLIESYIEEQ